jgi:hypothetical protein
VSERQWTLASARALLPDVRARTERAVAEVEGLEAQREALAADAPERRTLEEGIERALDRWAREMEALGVQVKGLWLVDFDSGSGYYCWRWPEATLGFFHGYEDGFGGRTPIQ